MGSWNGTCAISNLHIKAGQRVMVVMLLRNAQTKSFCYSNALYDVCPVPFYGKYDDYGGVDNCEGFGLNIVVESLRSQLYEFGVGANEYHDCEVRKKDFDISKLFEADHEERLGVEHTNHYDSDSYGKRELEKKRDAEGLTDSQAFELDRLANKIKKVDTFRSVTTAYIHGDVLDDILEKWYIEDYIGDAKGDKGYNNNYQHIYFKDLISSIPEYVQRLSMREQRAYEARMKFNRLSELDATELNKKEMGELYSIMAGDVFEWNDPCMAGRWMGYFSRDSSMQYALVSVETEVSNYIKAEDWDGLAKFTKECLTFAWVNSFMSNTRKIWTKQSGAGGQSDDPIGYNVLSRSVLGVLEREDMERREWMEEEDLPKITKKDIAKAAAFFCA